MSTDNGIAAQNAANAAAHILAAEITIGTLPTAAAVVERFDELRRHIYKGSIAAAGTPTPSAPKAKVSNAAKNDAFRHVLEHPDQWWNNIEKKTSPGQPDFKAKKTNKEFGLAGEYKGKPDAMALWLSDAPPGFQEALIAGDPSLCYPEPPATRVGSTAGAMANHPVPPPPDDYDEPPF